MRAKLRLFSDGQVRNRKDSLDTPTLVPDSKTNP